MVNNEEDPPRIQKKKSKLKINLEDNGRWSIEFSAN